MKACDGRRFGMADDSDVQWSVRDGDFCFRSIEQTTKNALGVATQITCAPQKRICEIGANAKYGNVELNAN